MKKLFSLFVLLPWLCFADAVAGTCQLYSDCVFRNTGFGGLAAREILTPDGKTKGDISQGWRGECFVCNNSVAGDQQCGDGDVVVIVENNKIVKAYQCDVGFYDNWERIPNINTIASSFCGDSPIAKGNVANAMPVEYRQGSSQSTSRQMAGSNMLTNSQKIDGLCKYVECSPGYQASSDRTQCVRVGQNQKCKMPNGKSAAIGDVFPGSCDVATVPGVVASALISVDFTIPNSCVVTCENGGWNIRLKDDSCQDGYEPDGIHKMCLETERGRKNRQNGQMCAGSGGTWLDGQCACDAGLYLQQNDDKTMCKCMTDYTWDSVNKKCKMLDSALLKKACNESGEARFDDVMRECVCNDRMQVFDMEKKKCVVSAQVADCNKISDATWDVNAKMCVCNDTNKEIRNGQCVEKASVRAAAQRAESHARITSILSRLDNITSGLGTSVWKTKEGNFNGARLASDSIAGVVLGTAGGLITSNVIKKNQVKGGFEDINCTVGGQVVAEWGDQFQVGIK